MSTPVTPSAKVGGPNGLARRSEAYTPALAKKVHAALRRDLKETDGGLQRVLPCGGSATSDGESTGSSGPVLEPLPDDVGIGGVMPNCVHPPLDVRPSAPVQIPVKPTARQSGRLFVVVQRDATRHAMLQGPRSAFNRLVATCKTICLKTNRVLSFDKDIQSWLRSGTGFVRGNSRAHPSVAWAETGRHVRCNYRVYPFAAANQ